MRGRGGARRAAAFVLALSWALAFAGCEGDGGGSPAAPNPAAPNPAAATEAPPPQTPSPQTPDAPVTLTVAQGGSSGGTGGAEPNQVVGPAEPVTLVDGGSARHVPLDRLFSGGDPGTVAVTSEDETVVTAQFVSDVAPPYVNIAPAGPGETTVVVTATTAAGSATQRIPATVEAAEAPRVIGEIPPAVLVGRGAGHPLEPRRRLRAGRASGGGRVAGRCGGARGGGGRLRREPHAGAGGAGRGFGDGDGQ